MLWGQREWDEELAYIAQKWAEQCIFEHECWPCRSSRSYAISQNLAELTYSCQADCEVMEHDWKTMIEAWYNEVQDFSKSLIPSIKFDPIYGHFVTMTWAETYRIGCGYTSYRVGRSTAKQLYVCDYAPAAIREKRMYKEGSPCSECPLNSCCGSTCRDPKKYAGLCRLSGTPPILPPKQTRLFYCSFQEGDSNCLFYPQGSATWEFVRTIDGIILSTVVQQQQSAVANFQQWIYARNGSCLRLNIRKGPNVDGDFDASVLKLEFERQNGKRAIQIFSYPPWQFVKSSLPMGFEGYFKLSIKMSVPAGAPPQFFEIKEIELDGEPCKSDARSEHSKMIYHLIGLIIFIHLFKLLVFNTDCSIIVNK
ncbi:CRISP/Allergen/PR-1-like [Parasteatoda tepidariorum]|uniref:CRISP/Allergen/PR-1-like n=1 Tax=Parasteatoda tepidariorum TaxID=114398 RepID=UPI0039BC6209